MNNQISGAVAVNMRIGPPVAAFANSGQRAPKERLGKGQRLKIEQGVQRVIGPLLTMSRDGDIGDRQADAGERWYRDYCQTAFKTDPHRRRILTPSRLPDWAAGRG